MELTTAKQTVHELKCIDPHFTALKYGRKTFEILKNDRDYEVGDLIKFNLHRSGHGIGSKIKEVDPIVFMITHILDAKDFREGLRPGFCILSINKMG